MDPDSLMDLAVSATKQVFGRAITYTPRSGSPVTLRGDFQSQETQASTDPSMTTTAPVLDMRTADLVAAGISPTPKEGSRDGDRVAFTVRGVAHTFDVLAVEERSPWSTVLILGRRGE